MKIIYQSDAVNIHDYRILSKLVQTGNDITLITYRITGVPVSITSLPGLRILHRPLLKFDVDWETRDKGDSPSAVLHRRVGLFRAILDFRAKVRLLCPDVIHAGMVQTSGLMAALSGFRPFILMPWGSDILISPRSSPWHWLATQYTVRRSSMITCDCQVVKKEIVRLTGYPSDNIYVVPQGIDLRLFFPRTSGGGFRSKIGWEDKRILIMTRSMESIYGHRYFLATLPKVIQAVPETRIVLVGSGSLESEIRLQVDKLGLTDYVYFAGRLENEKLPEFLNEADIYVSSSLSDGTSLSLLEALACRLPVVVTDVPANLEWVNDGENGFITPRGDSKILAEKLVCLLEDRSLRRSMGQRNLALARERADWDRNFQKFEQMYETLVAQKHA